MASTTTSLRDWLALYPLRLALVLVGALILATGLLVSAGGEAKPTLETTWYGDTLNARGFEKRTLGRAITLPTRETGAQRTPSIAIIENLTLPAAQFPMLELSFVDRDLGHRIALIWRNSFEPTVTQRLELEPGVALGESVRMASHRGWQGTISGIGIVAGHMSNVPLNLKSIATVSASSAQRFEMLTRPFQSALSRASVGEEHTAKTRRVWLAPWLGAAAVLALGLLAALTQRFVAPRPLWVAVGIAGAMILVGAELTQRIAVAHSAVSSTLVRPATRSGVSAALTDAPKTSALHVWSGDSRGYEFALASAPRRVHVALKNDALPAAQMVASGDIIVALGRRGVRFDPAQSALEWNVSEGGAAQRTRVDLVSAGDGDAVFKVRAP